VNEQKNGAGSFVYVMLLMPCGGSEAMNEGVLASVEPFGAGKLMCVHGSLLSDWWRIMTIGFFCRPVSFYFRPKCNFRKMGHSHHDHHDNHGHHEAEQNEIAGPVIVAVGLLAVAVMIIYFLA
jgi:hypothetical protein